jgi:hypothetical protein
LLDKVEKGVGVDEREEGRERSEKRMERGRRLTSHAK